MNDDLRTMAPTNPVPDATVAGRRTSPRARQDLARIFAAPAPRRTHVPRIALAAVCVIAVALFAFTMARIGSNGRPTPAAPTPDKPPWSVTATIRVTPWSTATLDRDASTERAVRILMARAQDVGYDDFSAVDNGDETIAVHLGGATELNPSTTSCFPPTLRSTTSVRGRRWSP